MNQSVDLQDIRDVQVGDTVAPRVLKGWGPGLYTAEHPIDALLVPHGMQMHLTTTERVVLERTTIPAGEHFVEFKFDELVWSNLPGKPALPLKEVGRLNGATGKVLALPG